MSVTVPSILRPRWYVIAPVMLFLAALFAAIVVFFLRLHTQSASELILKFTMIATFVGGGIHILWNIVSDALTKFTSWGVSRPTLRGTRKYPWTDIRAIRGHGYLVDFVFSPGTFRLNLILFENPRDVVRFVRERVPEEIIDGGSGK